MLEAQPAVPAAPPAAPPAAAPAPAAAPPAAPAPAPAAPAVAAPPAGPTYQPGVSPPAVPPPTPPAPPAAAPPAAQPAVVPPAPAAQPPAPAAPEPAKPAAPPPADEIKLKLPDGAKFDPAAIESFKAVAKAQGFSSAQAQALVDFQLKQNEAAQKAFSETVQRQRVADLEALKGDKEFGGSRFDKTRADAISAAKQFGGEDFSKLVEASGLDCHPAFVKAFARIRAAIAEDTTSSRVPNPAAVQEEVAPVARSQTQKLANAYDTGAYRKADKK